MELLVYLPAQLVVTAGRHNTYQVGTVKEVFNQLILIQF
jgi:hypothetical protein